MKALFVSDLDGTLLGRDSRLSPYGLRTLNELIAQGLPFTYATARSLSSARLVTKGLAVRCPVVTNNGVFIRDSESGAVLDSVAFAPEALQEIRAAVEQAGISPLVYSLVNGEEKVFWVAGTENEGIRYYFDNRQGDKRFTPVGSSDELYQGEIFYFTCIGEREELLPVYESLCWEKQVHCTLQQELYREEYWCELMPGKASKAAAVLRLRELLHAERVIAFGDAINDLPLFEAADEGYAVANAVPELKERADGIIASNDADGVVNWLQAFWSRQNEA